MGNLISHRPPLRGTSDDLDHGDIRFWGSSPALSHVLSELVLRFCRHFKIYSQSQHARRGIFSPLGNEKGISTMPGSVSCFSFLYDHNLLYQSTSRTLPDSPRISTPAYTMGWFDNDSDESQAHNDVLHPSRSQSLRSRLLIMPYLCSRSPSTRPSCLMRL